jgi:hypothetical protein
VHSLTTFPAFVKLDIKHKDTLRDIASRFPPYSDYNFVSLFTWDTDGEVELATLNDNLVIKFSDYDDHSKFLTFLGTTKVAETIGLLIKYCKSSGLPVELKLIGEAVIDAIPKLDRNNFVIKEDRDNHDYILSAANMSEMANFHPKKRTKYNHFMREYGGKFNCNELNLSSEDVVAEIKQLVIDWQNIRGKEDEDTKREFAAINRCLKHAKEFNIVGYGTYIESKLVAFTLFEIVHNKTAMLHFGKTNTTHKGSNEHLQHNLAKYLQGLDVELMNNEQDLGVEGLRKSKEASLPVNFLKKYTITPVGK